MDYTSEDIFQVALDDTGGEGVDAVLDTAGGDLIAKSVQATRPFGRLAGIVSLQGDLTPAYPLNQTIYDLPHGARVGAASSGRSVGPKRGC
jgi:NADPH2:quinone reductase